MVQLKEKHLIQTKGKKMAMNLIIAYFVKYIDYSDKFYYSSIVCTALASLLVAHNN
jgi:hypothetical protein